MAEKKLIRQGQVLCSTTLEQYRIEGTELAKIGQDQEVCIGPLPAGSRVHSIYGDERGGLTFSVTSPRETT